MGQELGWKAYLAMMLETTFKTSPGSPNTTRLPIYSCSVKPSQMPQVTNLLQGIRNPSSPTYGEIDVTGDIVVPMDHIGFGYWLTAIFGAPTTTGASDPYTHVWKVGTSQPSFLIERAFASLATAQYEVFNGLKVSRMSVSFETTGEIRVTLTVMGAKQTISTSQYDSSPNTFTVTTYNSAQMAIEEGGSSIAYLKKVDLNIDFGLDGDTVCIGSSAERTGINEGLVSISGSVEGLFQDVGIFTKANAKTESSLKVTVTSSASRNIEIFVPELLYDKTSPGQDGPAGMKFTTDYVGYYENGADASAVKITMKNGVASYA